MRHEKLAILIRGTTVSSSGDAGADIPIADQQVRLAVSRNCFGCHGGDKVEAGLDFRLPLTSDVESECKDAILNGDMPKDRQLSAEDRTTLVSYFKGRVKAALSR